MGRGTYFTSPGPYFRVLGRLCVNLLKFFEKFGLGFSDWDLFSRFFFPVFFHDDLTTGFPGFSVFVVRK